MTSHAPRIVLFIRTFSEYGGVEYNCFRFYHYLKKKGVDVKVVCGENRSGFYDPDIAELGLMRPGRLLKTLSFYLKSAALLKQVPEQTVTFAYGKVAGCDIFRTGGGSHLDYMIQSLKGFNRFGRYRKVLSRLIRPVNWIVPLLERRIFHPDTKTLFIAISSYVAEEIIGRFQLDSGRVKIIPNGVDFDVFDFDKRGEVAGSLRQRHTLSPEAMVIGFCSTNFERKGLRYIIESLPHLPKNCHLIVAGDRRPGRYLRLAKRLGVGKQVLFLGKVSNMPEFYGALDVLCHPSFHDTFGSVVAEALAMGVPVVITRDVGAKDIVKAGENGYVLEELSGPAVAEAIRKTAAIGIQDFRKYVFSDEVVFDEYYKLVKRCFKPA